MKKILSALGVIAVIGFCTPSFAAPPGPHNGHHAGTHHIAHRGGHTIRAGHHNMHRGHHMPPPHVHRHHGGYIGFGGVLARRGYWGNPYYCDYRLGWCDDYYHPMLRNGVYLNFGIPIRF